MTQWHKSKLKSDTMTQWHKSKLKSDTMTQVALFAYHCQLSIFCLRVNVCVHLSLWACAHLWLHVHCTSGCIVLFLYVGLSGLCEKAAVSMTIFHRCALFPRNCASRWRYLYISHKLDSYWVFVRVSSLSRTSATKTFSKPKKIGYVIVSQY